MVERRIREAQAAGAFDNLPGLGQPIAEIDGSEDTEWWWLSSWLKREGLSVAPPTLEIRRTVELALANIWRLPSEPAVRRAVAELNDKIRQAQFAVTWGPASSLLPLDPDEVIARWRKQLHPG